MKDRSPIFDGIKLGVLLIIVMSIWSVEKYCRWTYEETLAIRQTIQYQSKGK